MPVTFQLAEYLVTLRILAPEQPHVELTSHSSTFTLEVAHTKRNHAAGC